MMLGRLVVNKILRIGFLLVFNMIWIVTIVQAQSFDDYELDTSVPSFSRAFTITIPGDILSFSSIQRSPDNITMTNNWDIFTENGIEMDTGDILLIADYYVDATVLNLADVTTESSVLTITEALANVQAREVGDISALIVDDFEGYQFDTIDPTGLFIKTAVIDFLGGEFISFVLVTTSEDAQNDLNPLLIDIIGSLEKGAVFERAGGTNLVLSEDFVREEDGFTLPYPEGWSVGINPVGQSMFVTVTMGHPFSLDAPPAPGEPSAIIAYGAMTDLTGLPITMLNPETNAMRVIQQIIGAQPEDITEFELKEYRAAQVISASPNFDNWFVAIMLDEHHFVAANMFTATQADVEFFGTVIEMISESTWDAIPTALSSGDLETFVSNNSGLTLQYPSGWSGFDISTEIVTLINADDAFSKMTSQDAPDSGQVVITIFTHNLIQRLGDDEQAILEALNSSVFTEGVDDLEVIEMEDREIYLAEGLLDDANKLVILVRIEDSPILVSALTALNEMDDFRDQVVDIALSIEVNQ